MIVRGFAFQIIENSATVTTTKEWNAATTENYRSPAVAFRQIGRAQSFRATAGGWTMTDHEKNIQNHFDTPFMRDSWVVLRSRQTQDMRQTMPPRTVN
jgi:hypothetical protein